MNRRIVRMQGSGWITLAVHVAGWAPAVTIGVLYLLDGLGADPNDELLRTTGRWALTFLLTSLLPAALDGLAGWSGLKRARPWLGLYALAYGVAHAGMLVALEYGLRLDRPGRELRASPAMLAGILALALLVPLALNIADGGGPLSRIKGRKTGCLAYIAAVLAIFHYAALLSELRPGPVVLIGAVGLLELARVIAQAGAGPRPAQGPRNASGAVSPTRATVLPGTGGLASPRYERTRMWWAFVSSLLILSTVLYLLGLEMWEYWALLMAAVLVGWLIKP